MGGQSCLFRAASLLFCCAVVRHALFLLPLYPWNARSWLKLLVLQQHDERELSVERTLTAQGSWPCSARGSLAVS